MQCAETVETVEICYVQREDVTGPVHEHRACEANVVNAHSGNVVLCYNPPPFLVNQSAVRQQKPMWHALAACELGSLNTTRRASMARKLKPVHPGEILREEFMVPLGLSMNNMAMPCACR